MVVGRRSIDVFFLVNYCERMSDYVGSKHGMVISNGPTLIDFSAMT